MTPTQKVFSILVSVATLGFIVELVRRRRLREEYAWLWILCGVAMTVLATWYGLVEWLGRLTGAVAPTTTLFLFALVFLVLISVHYSTVLSRLTEQVRRLTQELAILEAERRSEADSRGKQPDAPATRSGEAKR
jgi:hypothetical protein